MRGCQTAKLLLRHDVDYRVLKQERIYIAW